MYKVLITTMLISISCITQIQAKGYSKKDIETFCKKNFNLPKKGIQPNGKKANMDVLHLTSGKYSYSNDGALLLFPNHYYILKLPSTYQTIGKSIIYGTDAADLLGGGGIVGGCSKEQLSEAIKKNNLLPKNFILKKRYR